MKLLASEKERLVDMCCFITEHTDDGDVMFDNVGFMLKSLAKAEVVDDIEQLKAMFPDEDFDGLTQE